MFILLHVQLNVCLMSIVPCYTYFMYSYCLCTEIMFYILDVQYIAIVLIRLTYINQLYKRMVLQLRRVSKILFYTFKTTMKLQNMTKQKRKYRYSSYLKPMTLKNSCNLHFSLSICSLLFIRCLQSFQQWVIFLKYSKKVLNCFALPWLLVSFMYRI